MITMKEYVVPKNIDEAYNYLTAKKNTTLLGGGAFLRMGSKYIATGIDLSKVGLDYIRESEYHFEIGAMATLGDIERSPSLNKYYNNILSVSVKDIVGIQLRNIVTVGGTVYSRYGFSDFITGLMALDTKVKLYKQGVVSLEEFLHNGSSEKDILECIVISKDQRNAAYHSMRNSKSDYAILSVAVSKLEDQFRIAVGARPGRAMLALETMAFINSNRSYPEWISMACDKIAEEIPYGSNTRASKDYRSRIAKVLLGRAIEEVIGNED